MAIQKNKYFSKSCFCSNYTTPDEAFPVSVTRFLLYTTPDEAFPVSVTRFLLYTTPDEAFPVSVIKTLLQCEVKRDSVSPYFTLSLSVSLYFTLYFTLCKTTK